MPKKKLLVFISMMALIWLSFLAFGQQFNPGVMNLEISKAVPNQGKPNYLIANLDGIKATIATDIGTQQTVFNGEIAFQIRDNNLVLKRLNLISNGVKTKQGPSGLIGLNLVANEYKTTYDPQKGTVDVEFQATLHYDLIDKIKGFMPPDKEEGDQFLSYTESMKGSLRGKIAGNIRADMNDKTPVSFAGTVRLELERPVLSAVPMMQLSLAAMLERITQPSEVLKVQPVFIGTGPGDASATGSAYRTLIRNAGNMWNRCGTERCITIRSNDPIYVDNDDYRVLSDTSEAIDLMNEVSQDDAVEIFVVERWDPLYDGGGASWSSGTASAKIVTCDQQLNVPCPTPCASCGAINQYHLAHELGHSLNLCHPSGCESDPTRPRGSSGSVMEASGFCLDNPNSQSARNCRLSSNPLLTWSRSICSGSPDIMD
jgi:hypothetical protein